MACCQTCGGVIAANTADETCNACTCTGTPAPYYNQGCAVQESHCMPVINQVFVTALSNAFSFIIPACNKTAIITFPGLVSIQIGSYLWSSTYGYLVVTEFDSQSGQVRVMNECLTGNAAPGTAVPRCSLFNVVDPPCNCPT